MSNVCFKLGRGLEGLGGTPLPRPPLSAPRDLVIAPFWGLRIVLRHVVFCFQSSLLAQVSLRERPLLAGNIQSYSTTNSLSLTTPN